MKFRLYIITFLTSALLSACSTGTDATQYIEEIYRLQDDIDNIIKQNGSGNVVEDITINPQQYASEQEILNNISNLEEEIKALRVKNEQELKDLQVDLDEVNRELENIELNNIEEIEKIKNNLIQKKEELEKVIASYPVKLKEEEDRLQAVIDTLKLDIEELKNKSSELNPEISSLESEFKEKQNEMITSDLGLPNNNIKELSFSRHNNSSVLTKSYNYYKIVYDNLTQVEVKRYDDGNDEEISFKKKPGGNGWLKYINEITRDGNLVRKVKEELDNDKKLLIGEHWGENFICGTSSDEVVVTYGQLIGNVRDELKNIIASTPSKIEIYKYCAYEDGISRYDFTKHVIDIKVEPFVDKGVSTYRKVVSETYYSMGQLYEAWAGGNCKNYSMKLKDDFSGWQWGREYVNASCYFSKHENVYDEDF